MTLLFMPVSQDGTLVLPSCLNPALPRCLARLLQELVERSRLPLHVSHKTKSYPDEITH
jgi:hypothetical protein